MDLGFWASPETPNHLLGHPMIIYMLMDTMMVPYPYYTVERIYTMMIPWAWYVMRRVMDGWRVPKPPKSMDLETSGNGINGINDTLCHYGHYGIFRLLSVRGYDHNIPPKSALPVPPRKPLLRSLDHGFGPFSAPTPYPYISYYMITPLLIPWCVSLYPLVGIQYHREY